MVSFHPKIVVQKTFSLSSLVMAKRWKDKTQINLTPAENKDDNGKSTI